VTVAERRTSALRILRPAEPESAGAAVPAAEGDPAGSRPEVDDVFARLRADRAATAVPEDDGGDQDEHEVDGAAAPEGPEDVAGPPAGVEPEAGAAPDAAAALRRRDADLAPIERELARALKRQLADEQNAVLDALRRSRTRPTLGELLPAPEAAVARYATAVGAPLRAAVAAGRAAVAAGGADTPPVDDLAGDVGAEVAGALRADVAAALEATGGDHAGTAERISTAYRTWKSTLAEPLARSAALAAEARGRLGSPGPVCWVPEPPACPACADNAAAGPLPAGEAFPSGARHPPAHPGCRCLVAPVDR
jgi:hypothetical protein